jgi:hypothetical protein
LRSYGKRLWHLRSWARLVTGRSDLWKVLSGIYERNRVSRENGRKETDHQYWQSLSKPKLVGDLRMLVKKGVTICLVYSSDGPAYYNYRGSLKDEVFALSSLGKIQVQLIKDSDHVFTLLQHQNALLQVIHEWAQKAAESQRGTANSGVKLC